MPAVKDAVIIGAGPAGIAAAIYLKRAGADIVLLEKGEVGGLLRSANLVENYPGFPKGLPGKELVSRFEEQMESLGIRPQKRLVKGIRAGKGCFEVETARGSLRSKNVLVATGTRAKGLPLDGADKVAGRIFYDVNAVRMRRGRALIIGGGDAAFDYALNLSGRGMESVIVSRSKPSCLKLLSERVKKEKIGVAIGCEPLGVYGERGKIELRCRSGERIRMFQGDIVLVATGRVPNDELLSGIGRNVRIKGRGPETNVPGLYAIGDVLGGSYRQTGIAVGSGILAAMMVEESLRRGEG